MSDCKKLNSDLESALKSMFIEMKKIIIKYYVNKTNYYRLFL